MFACTLRRTLIHAQFVLCKYLIVCVSESLNVVSSVDEGIAGNA